MPINKLQLTSINKVQKWISRKTIELQLIAQKCIKNNHTRMNIKTE